VDTPEVYRQRSGGVILPRGLDWWTGTAELRARFSDSASREPREPNAGRRL
jgi:hypothetical protein